LQRGFESNFDTNGVLYHIGIGAGTRAYQNPALSGDVRVTWSYPKRDDQSGTIDHFVQHRHINPVYSCTNGRQNEWMQVDLGPNRMLRPVHYCLRNDLHGSIPLRNWRLEGSNDLGENWPITPIGPGELGQLTWSGSSQQEPERTWTTLRNHTNDTNLAEVAMSEANWPIENCGVHYRFFRILNSASEKPFNLCCAGIELYGDLEEITGEVVVVVSSDSIE
jgi:hypothetical protein